MTMLALPEKSTRLSVRMPLAATVPNRASPAPPRTGSGTRATSAPRMGKRPRKTRIPPPTATTNRLLMPVIATRPTFWAKALTEKPLKTAGEGGRRPCRPADRW